MGQSAPAGAPASPVRTDTSHRTRASAGTLARPGRGHHNALPDKDPPAASASRRTEARHLGTGSQMPGRPRHTAAFGPAARTLPPGPGSGQDSGRRDAAAAGTRTRAVRARSCLRAPAPLTIGVSVDTSGPDMRVDFELTRPAGKGSYLVGLLCRRRGTRLDPAPHGQPPGRARHRPVHLRFRDCHPHGASPRRRVLRRGFRHGALPAGLPGRAGGGSPHHRVQLPQQTGTPDGGSPHPGGDGRPQGMSGRSADFFPAEPGCRHRPGPWSSLHEGTGRQRRCRGETERLTPRP